MKNTFYIIAGLLIVIWGIFFCGCHAVGAVHFLLAGAFFYYSGQTGFQQTIVKTVMGNLLYVLAAILVVAWVVGYYGTNAGEPHPYSASYRSCRSFTEGHSRSTGSLEKAKNTMITLSFTKL